jgi:hypothetical protein
MSILNITIDLLSSSITEIHGPVNFTLLKDFELLWMDEGFDSFRSHFKPESEWGELMLSYVPDETLEGRVTAPAYYDYQILLEGSY